MKINANSKISFGTYLGAEFQEKVLYAKSKNIFTKEQMHNLEKIENDGLMAVIDISDKYLIHKYNNGKSAFDVLKCLTLGNGNFKTIIADLSDAYKPTSNNKKRYFFVHKFVKIFDNDFNLAEKIKQTFNSFNNQL